MQELMLGALLVLTISWLVVRIRQNKAVAVAASKRPIKQAGAYHAVAIKYAENACDPAKAMVGRRFLSNAAPRLPLPECDYPACGCKFAHYADRRTDRDRRSPFAPAGPAGITGSYERERREANDRRKRPGGDHL